MSKIQELFKLTLTLIAQGQVRDPQAAAQAVLMEAAKSERKPRVERQPSLMEWEPPSWVPQTAWGEFDDHRRAFRGIPWTDHAKAGIVNELQKITTDRETAAQVLRNAITRGWRTVFPLPKQLAPSAYPQRDPAMTVPSNAVNQTALYLASDRMTPEQKERARQKAAELRRKA